jgi:hypothetical protein
MTSQEYISLETRTPLMKQSTANLVTLEGASLTDANVTLRIPATELQLKTSNLHIFLVRRGYIALDAAAERYDAI